MASINDTIESRKENMADKDRINVINAIRDNLILEHGLDPTLLTVDIVSSSYEKSIPWDIIELLPKWSQIETTPGENGYISFVWPPYKDSTLRFTIYFTGSFDTYIYRTTIEKITDVKMNDQSVEKIVTSFFGIAENGSSVIAVPFQVTNWEDN